jgi:hypothetical protein
VDIYYNTSTRAGTTYSSSYFLASAEHGSLVACYATTLVGEVATRAEAAVSILRTNDIRYVVLEATLSEVVLG